MMSASVTTSTVLAVAKEHWQAFALATASSTDNFLVGLSFGLGGNALCRIVLSGTSISNAVGAFLATISGSWIQHQTESIHSLPWFLAGSAFAYLAWKEYREGYRKARSTRSEVPPLSISSASPWKSLVDLAIPMTLNNVAGGIAGGVAGVSAKVACLYVLLVSFIFMFLGHAWGYSYYKKQRSAHQSTTRLVFWSVLLYSLLAIQSFLHVFCRKA